MPILAFHNIAESFLAGLNSYSPTRLKRLLLTLRDGGCEFVGLAALRHGQNDAGNIAVTFDDGYESLPDKALPVLEELNIPVAVFIPTGCIGQANTWDYSYFYQPLKHLDTGRIKEIADRGVTVGSHGMTHTDLTALPERRLKLEMKQSRNILEDITGRKVLYVSYPFGRFDDRVESAALEAGYERGFSMSHMKAGGTGFTRPRYAVYATDTPFSVRVKIRDTGVMNRLERIKGAVMNGYAGGTILLNRIRRKKY